MHRSVWNPQGSNRRSRFRQGCGAQGPRDPMAGYTYSGNIYAGGTVSAGPATCAPAYCRGRCNGGKAPPRHAGPPGNGPRWPAFRAVPRPGGRAPRPPAPTKARAQAGQRDVPAGDAEGHPAQDRARDHERLPAGRAANAPAMKERSPGAHSIHCQQLPFFAWPGGQNPPPPPPR